MPYTATLSTAATNTLLAATVFNDTALTEALAGLDPDWVNAPARTPLAVMQAVFGPHVTVIEYAYSARVRAYVATCMASHRAYLLDASGWDTSRASLRDRGRFRLVGRRSRPTPTPRDRVALIAEALGQVAVESTSLLAVAARFVEPGYPARRDAGRSTPADRLVTDLVRRWWESNAVTGHVWDLLTATLHAQMAGAHAVSPYLADLLGPARR